MKLPCKNCICFAKCKAMYNDLSNRLLLSTFGCTLLNSYVFNQELGTYFIRYRKVDNFFSGDTDETTM